jgi:hypothetical protein
MDPDERSKNTTPWVVVTLADLAALTGQYLPNWHGGFH